MAIRNVFTLRVRGSTLDARILRLQTSDSDDYSSPPPPPTVRVSDVLAMGIIEMTRCGSGLACHATLRQSLFPAG